MTKEFLKAAKEKMDVIEDLNYRFQSLLKRVEEDRKNGMPYSLPEFEAYGWENLAEFLERLDDAANFPLLEEARKIFDEIGIRVSKQAFDKLKSALSVRKEGLIEILKEMGKELSKLQNEMVQNGAKGDMAKYVEEGTWNELVTRANNWRNLEEKLGPFLKEMSDNTYLYKAVFEKALEEGPPTSIVDELIQIEEKASRIGGETLREHVKFEVVKNRGDPLGGVEGDLDKIARKKEELRKLIGEEVEMDKIIERNKPLQPIIDKLDKEHERVKALLGEQYRTIERLVQKHNSLATILKKNAKSMPGEMILKRLENFRVELERKIKKLEKELEKTLTPDARTLIESLLEGKLPEDWDEKQVVSALRELLEKKLSFVVKLS